MRSLFRFDLFGLRRSLPLQSRPAQIESEQGIAPDTPGLTSHWLLRFDLPGLGRSLNRNSQAGIEIPRFRPSTLRGVAGHVRKRACLFAGRAGLRGPFLDLLLKPVATTVALPPDFLQHGLLQEDVTG